MSARATFTQRSPRTCPSRVSRGMLLLALLVALPASADWLVLGTAPRGASTSVVRWRYAARNGTASPLAKAELQVPVPRAAHDGRRLLRVLATEPAQLAHDADDNLTLTVALGPLAPGETRMVTVTAELAAASAAEARPRPHAAPSPLLELDSAAVVALAAPVRAAAPDRQVALLRDTLSARLSAEGFRAAPRRVGTTLSLGRGDCTDLALVAVAVARAAGLPARLVSGWLSEGSGLLGPDTFHDWAEVYDGAWRVVDLHSPSAPGRLATHVDAVHGDALSAFRFRPMTPGLEVQMLDGGGTLPSRGGLR